MFFMLMFARKCNNATQCLVLELLLPLNGFLICIFVIYRWKKANFNASLDQGAASYKGSFFERYVDVSVGTFIPAILLIIFINTVALKYFGISLFG